MPPENTTNPVVQSFQESQELNTIIPVNQPPTTGPVQNVNQMNRTPKGNSKKKILLILGILIVIIMLIGLISYLLFFNKESISIAFPSVSSSGESVSCVVDPSVVTKDKQGTKIFGTNVTGKGFNKSYRSFKMELVGAFGTTVYRLNDFSGGAMTVMLPEQTAIKGEFKIRIDNVGKWVNCTPNLTIN